MNTRKVKIKTIKIMNSSVCRVCLAGSTGDLRLQSVNSQLLEVYEKLTNAEINSNSAKLCYICESQLRKCFRFAKMARLSEQYLKTVLETDIKAQDETVRNMLNIIKLQTLSVTTLKPIYLDGLLRKRPRKSCEKTEKLIVESTEKNIASLVPNEKVKLIRNETVITKLENMDNKELDSYDLDIDKNLVKNQTILLDNPNLSQGVTNKETVKGKNEINILKSYASKKVITQEGRIETEIKQDVEKITEVNENNITDEIHENITQVKDYVVINDTELYYECDVCTNIFPTRDELATHQTKHNAEKKPKYNIEEIIKNLPETNRPYCPICKKFFAGQSAHLIQHLKIHTGERPYICDKCGKNYRTSYHLQEHIRTHTKEKVHCQICEKSFAQKSSLSKHMLGHSGLYPHFCHLCGRTYTQSGQLKMHIRAVHEGIKPHGCEVCAKRYRSKSELTRHMDGHSKTKAYSCDKCGLKFTTTATLSRHRRKTCKMVVLTK